MLSIVVSFSLYSRPATSFLWFTSPFKTLKYIIWRNYKWLIIGLIILIIVIAAVLIFLYSMPVSFDFFFLQSVFRFVVVREQTNRNTDCKASLCLATYNNSIVCFLMKINRVGENITPLPLELTISRALKQHRLLS